MSIRALFQYLGLLRTRVSEPHYEPLTQEPREPQEPLVVMGGIMGADGRIYLIPAAQPDAQPTHVIDTDTGEIVEILPTISKILADD